MSKILDIFSDKIVHGLCSKKTVTSSSIKEWLQAPDLKQSESIRFGTLFEEALNNLIEISDDFDSITNSKKKTFITPECKLTDIAKGNKDIDILFRQNNTIFYRECKCNLQLDSEKSKATAAKVELIESRLKVLYPKCDIDAAILSMDFYNKKNTFLNVRLEGIGDFINRLKILGDLKFTEQEYINIGTTVGERYKAGVIHG